VYATAGNGTKCRTQRASNIDSHWFDGWRPQQVA
jgi:hypothetical protein